MRKKTCEIGGIKIPCRAMKKSVVLGIDIGGSGVKGALVDTQKGEFISERIRIPTPSAHNMYSILSVIEKLVSEFKWSGRIGCGFPGVIRSQKIETAANIGGRAFIGKNLGKEIKKACGCDAWVINDADAAGIAEVKFGAGKGCKKVVLMLTVGTGIGSAIFSDGVLLPNVEFGHLRMRDKVQKKNIIAEKICSDAVRKSHDLQWKQWAQRFNKYLEYVHSLVWPDLIILGGGIASKSEKFMKYIKSDSEIVVAELQNRAGIIGAAYEARRMIK